MVFVAALEPPRVAGPGVEPRNPARCHRQRPHRREQLVLQHPAERFRRSGGQISVRECDDVPPREEPGDEVAKVLRPHLVERREHRIGRPFRREQQLAHRAHRPPVRGTLVQVPQEPRILFLLRLESRRGDGRSAEGRHDAREHVALLVAPAREPHGDPAMMPVEEVRVPGEGGRVRELGEGILDDPRMQRAEHRVPRRVVGDGRAQREPEVRPGLTELDIGAVPQIESGTLDDADRMGGSGAGVRIRAFTRPCPCAFIGIRVGFDERKLARHERVRLREREGGGAGTGRGRVSPARDRLGRYRGHPVRCLEVG